MIDQNVMVTSAAGVPPSLAVIVASTRATIFPCVPGLDAPSVPIELSVTLSDHGAVESPPCATNTRASTLRRETIEFLSSSVAYVRGASGVDVMIKAEPPLREPVASRRETDSVWLSGSWTTHFAAPLVSPLTVAAHSDPLMGD